MPNTSSSGEAGFDVLDDILRQTSTHGVIVVRVPGEAEARAISSHIVRRCHNLGRSVTWGSFSDVDSGWRDIAWRMLGKLAAHDPLEVAQLLANGASRQSSVAVVPLMAPSSWDQAVAEHVHHHQSEKGLFVLLVSQRATFELMGNAAFEVSAQLGAAGLARWWEAVAQERQQRGEAELGRLQAWLDQPHYAKPSPKLGASAQRAITSLILARRAWPQGAWEQLVPSLPLQAVEDLVEIRDGLMVPRAGQEQGATTPELLQEVAEALVVTFPEDPWAWCRAAELHIACGQATAGQAAMGRALTLAGEAESRATLWERWHATLRDSDERRPELWVRGAELALDLGDSGAGLQWARQAVGWGGGRAAALVLGRAALAKGDLSTAHTAFCRVHEQSQSDADKADALAQLAEVCYANGDHARAEELAREVVHSASSPNSTLNARNVLGKLLLAASKWQAADEHFAEDAWLAEESRNPTAALRAQVNRAVALLSRGRTESAEALLKSTLKEAEARSEPRAVGFALSNLAVLAIQRHDYARGLAFSERAISLRRRLGDRLGFARDVTNLVELRLRLGLVGEADQALRFGLQALSSGAPASRLAELGLAAARLHLARGSLDEATREVAKAREAAIHASDGDKLGECHRLAAQVAIERGELKRASTELARAKECMSSPFARAEVAVLEARAARAAGKLEAEQLQAAVELAQQSEDHELMREAHVLAVETALSAGTEDRAESHLLVALAHRDQVAGSLPPALRSAFLGRASLVRLAQLEQILREDESAPQPPPSSSRPSKRCHESPRRFVGRHPAVHRLVEGIRRVGATDTTALILGESGTGKELVAEALHRASPRSQGPLVKVNCAALVESLLLSELFGHERGSFTGATSRRRGRFERAHGGTLFLDEIGDISPRTQVALLRALEERVIERVGGTAPIPVNVRIVCATNRDLKHLVEAGQFREDLFYRLSGFVLKVPALRERPVDLPELCQALLGRIARERDEAPVCVTREGLSLLEKHHWPGNVRELENVLRVASLFAVGSPIGPELLAEHCEPLARVSRSSIATLPPSAHKGDAPPPSGVGATVAAAYGELKERNLSLAEMKRELERECIARALGETSGNISRAARVLGMKRPRLSQLVKQYELLAPEKEQSS